MTSPRVLTIVGTHDGSSLWRAYQPARELQRKGHFVHFFYNDPDDKKLAKQLPPAALAEVRKQPELTIAVLPFDAVSFARLSTHEAVLPLLANHIDQLHRLGKAVFYELDDDMFLHAADHLTAEEDQERLAGIRRVVHTVKLCDGVTVSSKRLRSVTQYATGGTIPVAYVPNLIDYRWWRQVQAQSKRTVPSPTIGWAGAKRQEADLAPMAEGWRRIAARFPEVRFVAQGWAPPVIRDAVPADRLTVLPFLALEHYPMGLVNIDIGCCSVADTPFNACKTPIKALEYGASGAAVVATTALYGEIIRHQDTGLIANDADAWELCLARLVADPAYRAVLAGRLRRRILADWTLEHGAERWLDAWDWLLQSYRERKAA